MFMVQAAQLEETGMELRVEVGRLQQLLQQRTDAVAQRDAEILRLRSVRSAQAQGASSSAPSRDAARLRAALTASEAQRARDGAAHERELAALHRAHAKQVAALQAAVAHGAGQELRGSAGPRTPDTCSTRRPLPGGCELLDSASAAGQQRLVPELPLHSSRQHLQPWGAAADEEQGQPSAQLQEQLARLRGECAALAAQKVAAEATSAAALAEAERQRCQADRRSQRSAELEAEVAAWRNHCQALPQAADGPAELVWEHGQKDALFPLQDYVSASMLKGAQLGSTPPQPQHHMFAARAGRWSLRPTPSEHLPWGEAALADPPFAAEGGQISLPEPASGPEESLAGKEAEQRPWQNDDGSSLFSRRGAEAAELGVVDASDNMELSALLQALEATVLHLPLQKQPEQVQEEVTAAKPARHAGMSALAQAPARSALSAAVDELGGVRSDIAAALQRRSTLQAELRALEAQLGESQAALQQTQAQAAAAEQALRASRHEAGKAAHLLRERTAQLSQLDAQLLQSPAAVTGCSEAGASHAPPGGLATLQSEPDTEASMGAPLAQQPHAQAAAEGYQQRLLKAEQQLEGMQRAAAAERERHAALEADVAARDAALGELQQRLREAEARRTTPSGRGDLERWDDLIEEAAVELSELEEQLHAATGQLLQLQGRHAQLAADAERADAAKERASAEAHAARQALQEALAEGAAARQDAQQQRAATELAAQQCAAAGADLRRVRAEVAAAEAELQGLKGELSSSSTALQDQQGAIAELQRALERAAEQTRAACNARDRAQAEVQAVQKQAAAQEARLASAREEQHAVQELQRTVQGPFAHPLHGPHILVQLCPLFCCCVNVIRLHAFTCI
jgi:hypothetical protein